MRFRALISQRNDLGQFFRTNLTNCERILLFKISRYRCDSSGARAGVYISEVGGEGLDQSQCYCQKIHGANFVSASNSILVRSNNRE